MRAQLVIALATGLLVACSPQARQGPRPTANGPSANGPTANGPAAPPAESYRGYRYTFRVDAERGRLDATLCFSGVTPSSLACPMPSAEKLLLSASTGERKLTRRGEEVPIVGVHDGDCISYRVDLERALDRSDTHQGAARIGRDMLLSPDLWLWNPEPRPANTEIRARFELPPKLHVAVPWPRDDNAAYPFRVPDSAFVWRSQAAFGHFEARLLDIGDSHLEVAVLGDDFEPHAEQRILAWLRRSAGAVAAELGRFPVARAQLLLVPRGAGASSFGLAMRGGGASAMLLLADDASGSALADDWTAVHELMHFALPPLENSSAWLYEGVATYLTATARARSGMISERAAWWELLDGFERGEAAGSGVSLREESANMHANRSYWRVYWAGAAIALTMDVALRKRGSSLPALIAKLASSKLDLSHRWTAAEVIARLDRLSGGNIPSSIVNQHIDARAFPDTAALRKALGVQIAPSKSARFERDAPGASLRHAIMNGG